MMIKYMNKQKENRDTLQEFRVTEFNNTFSKMHLMPQKEQSFHYEGCIHVQVECSIRQVDETLEINVNSERTIEGIRWDFMFIDLIKVCIKKLKTRYFGLSLDACKIVIGSSILDSKETLNYYDIQNGDKLQL